IQTLGGGVCFSSSILYQLALKAGFKIIERSPHQRSIHSVPLGLDATVWDQGADLKIQNTWDVPLLLHQKTSPEFISLQLQGRVEPPEIKIYTQPHTLVSPSGKVFQKVIVWRQMKGKSAEKISEDLYPEQ
ncbi:MAG: VanW family protein, partial [Cyanobacteria bacterium]|nr:VanW family protein [Cyanobacteriota bacterium]